MRLRPDQPRSTPARPIANTMSDAHQDFTRRAIAAGMDPNSLWVGGYADYEWDHLRRLLDIYGLNVDGRDLLEFGCNVGASSVVLAALGGRVTAIDVSADAIGIASANLARHSLDHAAQARHIPDTRTLPFASASFDFIIANSVLEYVDPDHLDKVMAELHRVLRPGGKMLICGTASRLAPREIHSRRWLINYVPRAVDSLIGGPYQRGISPLHLARCIKGRFIDASETTWLQARTAIHGQPSRPMRVVAGVAPLFRCSPGWLAPNIELLLAKPA